jgi:hypothetical protein
MSGLASKQVANLRPRRGNPNWVPGKSGNPAGRAKHEVDIAALAREHGPKCILVIAKLLEDPDSRVRVSAATVLLDRGFGRPNQNVTATGDGTLTLHLLAAQTIGRELLDGKVIDGHISPDTQGDGVETNKAALDQTLPTE